MSNLKFKHDVNSFAEAEDLVCVKGGDVTLAYNTVLAKVGDDYAVIHHTTPIITFHPDGSATIDAAWVSRTTANRLHHYKPEMVEGVGSRIVKDGRYEGRYAVRLRNHPGEFDIWEGEKYRIYPNRTVVKV